MKTAIVLCLFFAASISGAAQVRCHSKYFIGAEVPVVLKAAVDSESHLSYFELKIENQVTRAAKQLSSRSYNGRKYKNMIAFDLDGPEVEVGNYKNFVMTLLLPRGFSSTDGDRFEGIIAERASDGGSYNRVFCRLTAN